MSKEQVLRGARLIVEYDLLRKRSDAKWEEGKRLLGLSANGICYSILDDGINIEIPLATYLSLYPATEPTLNFWDHNGTTRCYFNYAARYLGKKGDTNVFVSARTPAVDMPQISQTVPA